MTQDFKPDPNLDEAVPELIAEVQVSPFFNDDAVFKAVV